MPHTDISTIGEFGLIDRIRKIVDVRVDDSTLHDNLLMGIADDAAVYKPSPGKVQLFTTDALIEGIHFDLTFTSFMHLGWQIDYNPAYLIKLISDSSIDFLKNA